MGGAVTIPRERRHFTRIRLAESGRTVHGRIRPGLTVRVLDLSEGGGLVETAARLLPGARVEVHLGAGLRDGPIRATIVRCVVGSVTASRILFHGALQFDRSSPVRPVSLDGTLA